MPQPSVLELWRILRVDSCPTINRKVTQFTITGEAKGFGVRQVSTIRALEAALCDRVKNTDQLVEVKWREHPKYGPTLLTAELDRTKFQHD